VILLPSTTTIPGRILTFKDIAGTFLNSTITFSTAAATQTFEGGTIRQTYNDPFGSYSFIAGDDSKWYTIGGSRMNAAHISTIASINLNSLFISTASLRTNTLQIRDSSLGSTTTSFYQSSILYYSSATGNFIWGGTRAPVSLVIRPAGSFLPTQISGLAVWLDASDPNTLAITGGSVTTWNDKSGNRRNATLASGTVRYNTVQINTIPVVSFGAASQMNLPNITYASATRSVFAVVRTGSGLTLSYYLVGNTSGVSVQLYTLNNATLNYNKSGTSMLGSTGSPPGLFNAVSIISATNVSNGLFVNGSGGITLNNAPSAFTVGSGVQYLGQTLTSATDPFDMAELIIYDTALALPMQQQQIEGYLAWKWGLVANLPSSHLYKNSPP
jgi:hypothetical protein